MFEKLSRSLKYDSNFGHMDTHTDHFTPLMQCVQLITGTHQNMHFVVRNAFIKWNEFLSNPSSKIIAFSIPELSDLNGEYSISKLSWNYCFAKSSSEDGVEKKT